MDTTLSKKWKVVIGIVLAVLAFPLYALSNPGMQRWIDGCWANPTDTKTPEKLLFFANLYDWTGRSDKADQVWRLWLLHYGGDESDKDKSNVYISWEAMDGTGEAPWTDDHPRPEQKGEDWRKLPHPLTAKVLLRVALHQEAARRYQECKHVMDILRDEKNGLQVDIDIKTECQAGDVRHKSRSF